MRDTGIFAERVRGGVCDFVLNYTRLVRVVVCLAITLRKRETRHCVFRYVGQEGRVGGAHVWMLSVTSGPLQWPWSVLLFLLYRTVCFFLSFQISFFFFFL